MASKGIEMVVALVFVTVLWVGASAQPGCTSALIGLSPCLNFVSGNASTPSSSCCSQFSSVVESQPVCLCSLLNGGGSSLGITINQTRALALPGACNVKTPPASQCNAVNNSPPAATSPVPSPESSPSDSSSETPTTSTSTPTSTSVPSESGSKTTPTSNTSDGSIVKPLQLTIVALFIASFASSFLKF
ncbi:Bifunctional inhibitor/plant lipid transfer protein/seed storage helical domain [Dillenia turbinata]|uniref:Bifunctional inhibitor/plant lipid transfer protein/seed storage helical domain n=1 Tax=Dillenia turbinata TaxID=194707 RepID=A0AAN8W1U7_9MAGN